MNSKKILFEAGDYPESDEKYTLDYKVATIDV